MMTFEEYILEANFSKTLRILRGEVPHVNTLAIFTAHNPMGMPLSQNQNELLNKKLKADLKVSNYAPIKVAGGLKGKYGDTALEDSFIVPHISKEAAIAFGTKFDQKGVIWGQKQDGPNGPFIRFEMIERQNNKSPFVTTNVRNVVIAGEKAANRDDFYSGLKMPSLRKQDDGATVPSIKKFFIPFYDPDYDTAAYSADRRSVNANAPVPFPPQQQLKKAESFYIPFFDDIRNGIMPLCDVEETVSFYQNEIPANAFQIVENIKAKEIEMYDNDKTEKHRWMGRGGLRDLMKQLK